MAKTQIEWTDYSWNPWQGCRKVSTACDNCYMYRDKKRFGQNGSDIYRSSNPTFLKPLTYKAGSKVFTCSWSDFFLKEADEWRDDAWDIIRKTPHLTYQIITKRPENIKDRLPDDWEENFGHVWLGVTAGNQEMANKRIPILLDIPASVHFVSIEPMRYANFLTGEFWQDGGMGQKAKLDWVIVGGESGKGARKMCLTDVENVYSQCAKHGTPFFFKQWGDAYTGMLTSISDVKQLPEVSK